MDETYKNQVQRLFGRRKGSLWRAEKDYYAANFDPLTTRGTANKYLKIAEEIAKDRRDGLNNPDGWSRKRMFKYAGILPMNIWMNHPELIYDDRALAEFFRNYPAFSIKGK